MRERRDESDGGERVDPGAFGWLDRLFSLSAEMLVIQRAADLRTDYVSPSVESLLGMPAEEAVARWAEIIHVDDQPELGEIRRWVAAEVGREDRTRARLWHADGRLRHFEVTMANHGEDPIVGGILIRGRDVTSMVETEAELQRSRARFEAIVTRGPGATLLANVDGRIQFASESIRRLIGHDPGDLTGRQGLRFIHPDDRDQATNDFAGLREATGQAETTLRVLRADGGYEWIGFTAINRLDDPDLGTIVFSMRTVNEEMLAERRIERLLRNSSGASLVLNTDGEITWSTPGVEQVIGHHRSLGPEAMADLVADQDVASAYETFHKALDAPPEATFRLLARAGPSERKGWVDITVTNAIDDPAIAGVIVNVRDVDDAVRAGATGHRLSEVLENTTDMVCMYDRDLNRVWANATATEILGPSPVPPDEAFDQLPAELRELPHQVRDTGSWRGEVTIQAQDGRSIPIEATTLLHTGADGEEYLSLIARDISERKAFEAQLEARARHDPLTGLPNRLYLSEVLGASLARDDDVALLFLDLDQFKAVNDSQGHDAGDQLLVTAAERLRRSLRPSDLVARFGGDEFIVLLPGVSTSEQARPLAERVLDQLRGPVQLGPIKVYLTGSAGIALARGTDATTLISNADAAMYKAKAEGRDRVAVFTSELRARTEDRLGIAHALGEAIDRGALDVWFQPMVDTHHHRPQLVEALVRWTGLDGRMADTQQVIEVAEESGLIARLGETVIESTCAAIATLGPVADGLRFAVNLSAHQLTDHGLPDALETSMARHGVDPTQLVCEITESAVMLDVETSAAMLERIHALGIGIAIDDFGTGYSSLAYLQRFPVQVLKIDREFVRGLHLDADWKRSLAAGIISLGHSLGLHIVAEGVEEAEQAEVLALLGCDKLQGFLFAEPTPVDELPDALARLGHRRERDPTRIGQD
ncbi:MAG: EAL domain-containing protein [Acidimicrobiales bacterium]|nr:EAL domain-containing protein [Acidimicrobiales bacterium]